MPIAPPWLRAHALVTQPHDLVIVGDGPDRAALEGLAAELGISDTDCADPSRLVRMAQEGPEWAKKQFDQGRAADDLLGVLARFGTRTQGRGQTQV